MCSALLALLLNFDIICPAATRKKDIKEQDVSPLWDYQTRAAHNQLYIHTHKSTAGTTEKTSGFFSDLFFFLFSSTRQLLKFFPGRLPLPTVPRPNLLLVSIFHTPSPLNSKNIMPAPRPARIWYCGWCHNGPMSIALDSFCLFCRRRKDIHAKLE